MKAHFSRFLAARPGRLHFAAHSHHPWPDESFDAQARAWLEAAELADHKWGRIFGEVMPAAQEHVRRLLGLPDAGSVAFAPSTHELFKRVMSCLERVSEVRILSTDSEFHSFERQVRRWEETRQVTVERVPTEPFDTFAERFLRRAREGNFDLVYVSHVFFNSGWIFSDLEQVVLELPDDPWVIVDGYHAFCALPVDLSRLADRVFYTGGGYKYAMSGEGVCFLHCPPGWGPRPVDTGWFAGFGELENRIPGVPYPRDARRFLGATLDPTPLYRFRAVHDFWNREGITPASVHAHARRLQEAFLDGLDEAGLPGLSPAQLVPDRSWPDRGNFLTFRTPEAGELHERLTAADVTVDHRDDRLRFGFGIYQDQADLMELLDRLRRIRQGVA
jgi:kynureninase